MHKNTHIERVLIVLDPDGSFKAAHQESLSIIKAGGTVLASVQEPATALTAEALSQALPSQGAILAQLAAVTAERDKLLAAAPTSPVASPAPVAAPAAPPVVEEPVAPVAVEEPVAPVAVEELTVAPLEADPAAGSI